MATTLGLVGLPNAGKSTLFNALTAGHAAVAPYPFTTTDRNIGVASVDDPRLAALAQCVAPERMVPATIEFVDIAGLVRGAHHGEGLGNQFLSQVLSVEALAHVVRGFDEPDVAHTLHTVDPVRDLEVITTELLLKDLDILERRRQKEQKAAKGGDQHAIALLTRLDQWTSAVAAGTPIRQLGLSADAQPRACGIDLLTAKPLMVVVNVSESDLTHPLPAVEQVQALAAREGSQVVVVCAKLESELAELELADREVMMRELSVAESALPKLVRAGYALLQLVTFYTTASKILQAWTVPQGFTAPQAAGTIHTDFAQQFIRAEVIQADVLIRCGGESQARSQGLLRLEGKAYVVQDGDVIHFKVGA